MAIEDDILAAVTAIKAKTDLLEFYPFARVTGTLTPNVAGDYFFYERVALGNVLRSYNGNLFTPTESGYDIVSAETGAIWSGAGGDGVYTAGAGATGDATLTTKYMTVYLMEMNLKAVSKKETPAILDMRNI